MLLCVVLLCSVKCLNYFVPSNFFVDYFIVLTRKTVCHVHSKQRVQHGFSSGSFSPGHD